MFLAIFILTTLVLIGYSLHSAANQLIDELRYTTGGVIYLYPNHFDFIENQEKEEKRSVSFDVKQYEQMRAIEGIEYGSAKNYGYVKGTDIRFIPGDQDSPDNHMGRINGIHHSALEQDFLDGNFQICEGRHLLPEDSTSLVISHDLAVLNDWSLGDEIHLTHAELDLIEGVFIDSLIEKTAFASGTIVGIFEGVTDISGNDQQPTAGRYENRLYASHDILVELELASAGMFNDGAVLLVQDPASMSKIGSLLKDIDLEWEDWIVRQNSFNYQKIMEDLEVMKHLVFMLISFASLVSGVIFFLLLAFRIRGRVHEAGILLSMGVKVQELILQFILEILMVAVLAKTVALGVLIMIEQILQVYFFGDFSIIDMGEDVYHSGIQNVKMIYQPLSFGSISIILGFGILLLCVSVWICSIPFIRLKPRQIMNKLS